MVDHSCVVTQNLEVQEPHVWTQPEDVSRRPYAWTPHTGEGAGSGVSCIKTLMCSVKNHSECPPMCGGIRRCLESFVRLVSPMGGTGSGGSYVKF